MSMQALSTQAAGALFAASGAAALQVSPEFLEALPVAIYACGADGRLLWFNSRASKLWGRNPIVGDPSELLCGSCQVFLDDRQITPDETPMAYVLRTGVAVRGAEARVERPDGSTLWAVVHIEPVRNDEGAIIGAINCFHETTAPPLAHERRLAATYEQAGIGIVEIDRDGKFLRVNAHLRHLLGYSQSELFGKALFELTHPADVEKDREQYRRQVNGEIEGYALEKRFLRRDGSIMWASITSRSVCDSEGRFLYAVRVQQDITHRKQTEEILARYADEQAALHQLTALLQCATSVEDVCSAAIDAMFRALRCPRAAVLLFDANGVMRFVSARGLSPDYMKAVEGHSPWKADTRDAQPICIDDVHCSDLPDELKQTVVREGIGALAFVPLQQGDHLFGKFMVYYDQPNSFTPTQVQMALTVARHVAFSLESLRAERAARHLAAIVESSDDAIVSKDLDATITSWNRGAELLFGFTAEEAVGNSITIVIPPDRLDEEPAILKRIRAGERIEHFETVRQRKDGSLVDISLTISPIRDANGAIIGASKIARNINDRKAAEAKLRESERRLRDLLSAIPAAIYTTDADGKLTYFNEAAVEFAGRTPTLGTDEWCVAWKLYWPDGRLLPHDQCPMAIALKEGRSIRGVEAIAERPDGTRVPFIPYPTPLRDSTGKIVGAINMLVDISQRKEAETQQRILLNELNHRVKNNMQMLQSLLSSAARRARSAEAQQALEEASARISAMASAQRLLYGATGAQRFDAAELLKAVCETTRQTFPTTVEIVYQAVPVQLPNDVAMPLALILNELLTNAVKHGGNGNSEQTVHVTLSSQGHSLSQEGLSQEGLVLHVEDGGPGFDFERVRASSSGLRLVDGLARQLGGKLTSTRTPRSRCGIEFPRGLLS
jgi:PAS domain S-box-containing protein